MNDESSKYLFITTWQIDAPIEKVWEVLINFEEWPKWWRGLKKISEKKQNGKRIYYLTVGFLFYFLSFSIIPEDMLAPKYIFVKSYGDLKGSGKYELSEESNVTTVSFLWDVTVTKPWVIFASKFARPIFISSHNLIMRWFAQGMAKQLNAKLLEITYK